MSVGIVQGYLHVDDPINGSFSSKYFLSHPFVGLQWQDEKPNGVIREDAILVNDSGGWVFGGNILLENVTSQEKIFSGEFAFFPFKLVLNCEGRHVHLSLFCEDETSRQVWVEEIDRVGKFLRFVHTCSQCGALPSQTIFKEVSATDEIRISHFPFDPSSLAAMSNFKCSNQYSTLTSIALVNCRLDDSSVELLMDLLSRVNLESLSLSENFITCKGIKFLQSSLTHCSGLKSLDLSSNLIADEGGETLAAMIAQMPELIVLDISRNLITEKTVVPLTLYISRHSSLLASINLSYNRMGDGAAAIVALLMHNRPSHLKWFDLSYCGITRVGAREISSAISDCESLEIAVLKGCDVDATTLMELTQSTAAHHCSYSARMEDVLKDEVGLTLHIGGLSFQGRTIHCFPFKTIKAALPYVDQSTMLKQGILRRRLQQIYNPSHGDQLFSKMRKTTMSPESLHHRLQMGIADVSIVCVKVAMSLDISSAEEFAIALADVVGADFKQFRVLSCSFGDIPKEHVEDTHFFFITMSVHDASWTLGRLYSERVLLRNITKLHPHEAMEFLISAGRARRKIPTSLEILSKLKGLAQQNSPPLMKIGVRSVFLQEAKFDLMTNKHGIFDSNGGQFQPPTLGFNRLLVDHKPIDSLLRDGHRERMSPAKTRMIEKALAANGAVRKEFLPRLSPSDLTHYELDTAGDTDDEEFHDTLAWNSRAFEESPSKLIRFEDLKKRYRKVASAAISSLNPENEDVVAQSSKGLRRDSVAFAHIMAERNRAREIILARQAAKRERRTVNEKIILGIRKLKKMAKLETVVAQFWEGCLGNRLFRSHMIEVWTQAFKGCSLFPGVALRRDVCEAMIKRDTDKLSVSLERLESEGLDGGVALALGRRMLSELLNIKKRWEILSGQSVGGGENGDADDRIHFEYLDSIHDFLMECALHGYAGPELGRAIEVRQKLLIRKAQVFPSEVQASLEKIKRKALVINLLISRDAESLPRACDEMRVALADDATASPELVLAQSFFSKRNVCIKSLVEVVKSAAENKLDAIEMAIAHASYCGVHGVELAAACDVLHTLGSDPGVLMNPMLQGLRDGDTSKIDSAFKEQHRVGWKHVVIDIDIVKEILAMRNNIFREETMKNNLIKVSLALKNGLNVNVGEMVRLQHNVKSSGLDQDPIFKPHMELVAGEVRKLGGLQVHETLLQELVDAGDVRQLKLFLSGRGTGTLVMSASTPEILEVWLNRLQQVCEGSTEAHDNSSSVISGTLEKAARDPNPQNMGKLRGWRTRFFVLDRTNLTYFTKLGGEKKGFVRVRGGAVRLMNPSETGGRQRCIELQEGRDISIINPDLIGKAEKLVKDFHCREIEADLTEGLARFDQRMLESALAVARDLDIVPSLRLMDEAKNALHKMERQAIIQELYVASFTVPKREIDELVRKAMTLDTNPLNTAFQRVVLLSQKQEPALSIEQARGGLEISNDGLFKQAIAYLGRFDGKRLKMSERRSLTAALFQHSGAVVLDNTLNGEALASAGRLFRYTLSCCDHLHIETEAMQLARLLLSLTREREVNAADSNVAFASAHSVKDLFLGASHEKSLGFTAYLNDPRVSRSLNSINSVDKYSNLNLKVDSEGPGLFSKITKKSAENAKRSQMDRTGTTVDVLTFTEGSIAQPLLKESVVGVQASKASQQSAIDAVRLFDALLVVMGDRDLSSLPTNWKSGPIRGRYADTVDLCQDLIKAGMQSQAVADELFMQLCKQLRGNPSPQSCEKGWLLFSLYLHFFSPSTSLLFRLVHFVASAIQGAQKGDEGCTIADPVVVEEISVGSAVSGGGDKKASNKLRKHKKRVANDDGIVPVTVRYCAYLLGNMEQMVAATGQVRGKEASAAHDVPVSVKSFVPRTLSREIIALALCQDAIDVDIWLMTGSCHRLKIRYGDIFSPFFLLPIIYHSIMDPISANKAPHSSMGGRISHAACRYLFHGFGFFREDESSFSDMQEVNVQPDFRSFISWDTDFIWELCEAHINVEEKLKNANQGTNYAGPPPTAVVSLRRCVGAAHECLANSVEIFGDVKSIYDHVGHKEMWANWLHEETESLVPSGQSMAESDNNMQQHLLPLDAVRVDLLFGEDTRFINSGLYGGTDVEKAFLLGIQLALSWEDVDSGNWGEGHNCVSAHTDLSIRPICRINPPQQIHLLEKAARVVNIDTFEGHDSTVSALKKNRQSRRMSVMKKRESAFLRHRTSLSLLTPDGHQPSDVTIEKRKAQGNESESATGDVENIGDDNFEEDDVKEIDDDSSSAYESDLESDEEGRPTKAIGIPRSKMLLSFDLNDFEKIEIGEKLELLGVEVDSYLLTETVRWASLFHQIVVNANVLTSSPRFRYCLKRAYVDFCKAWPLYGSSFFNGHYLVTGEDVSVKKLKKRGETVLISISCNGLLFLDPLDWSLLFFTPLHDIDSASTQSGASKGSLDEGELINLVVNGLEIKIVTSAAHQLLLVLEWCSVEVLAQGYFPHGTRTVVNDDSKEESHGYFHTAEVALRSYQHNNPLMPSPPLPPVLQYSPNYFSRPRSKREILAQERAEEEAMEATVSRLAAAALAEKHQMLLEQGRKDVKRFDKGDGSDGSDEEEIQMKKPKRKTKRGTMRTSVKMEDMLRQQVVSATCGVSSRTSRVEYSVPAPPRRRQGHTTRFDDNEHGRITSAPFLRSKNPNSDLMQPEGNVSSMWPTPARVKEVAGEYKELSDFIRINKESAFKNQFKFFNLVGGSTEGLPMDWSDHVKKHLHRSNIISYDLFTSQTLIAFNEDAQVDYIPCGGVHGRKSKKSSKQTWREIQEDPSPTEAVGELK